MKVIKTAKWKDKMPGGKADDKTPNDFPKDQVERGIKIEMEHTHDKHMAEEISMDHIEEFGNYYDALDKMEEKLKKEKGEK